MAGRVAIDFGTSNTVVASWDHIRQQGIPVQINELGHAVALNDELLLATPSLIHYGSGERLYGNQVLERNLAHSARSFQWMKRYLAAPNSDRRDIDGQQVLHANAAEDFLTRFINAAKQELSIAEDEEVAFSIPVESFEHYSNWLEQIASRAGLKNIRFVDESTAVALGYSARLFPDEACLVFDFGAGFLNVSIIRQEAETDEAPQRCRVLSKAGSALSGSVIDEWIFQDIIQHHGYNLDDPEIQAISRLLLAECENLKERLSLQESSTITVVNPLDGTELTCAYSRTRLEQLLAERGAFALIEQILRNTLAEAQEQGTSEDKVKLVLMVGGSSLIPSVQHLVREIFGKERVRVERPFDAVARGAAAFIAGAALEDYLQHDYELRFRNVTSQQFENKSLISKGTRYPSNSAVATLKIKAINDGQEDFWMQICELSRSEAICAGDIEICFDELGNARLNSISPEERENRRIFWLNEAKPTFIRVETPVAKGDECFDLRFSIDANRHLLLSTQDLKSGRLLQENYPVIKFEQE